MAGSVAFEVCEAFRVDLELEEPICAACGHLVDDHEPVGVDATVRRLRRRGPAPATAPARKAS